MRMALLMFGCVALACDNSGVESRSSASGKSDGNSGSVRDVDYSKRGLIVVLGSSTAAGVGPKDPKNAWVARYKARLAAQYPNVILVNLAVGGQTTFEVQPTGYVPKENRPAPVEGKNITAALALAPSAIIVNLPSNDQANDYSLAEQLENYDRIAALATSAHVPLWVSTSQPRNFDESARIDDLMQLREAIKRKFAPRSLDFWTPFASPNGFIKPSYNAGDGTHLNDSAHALLADIVESAQIPEQFSAAAEPRAKDF